MKKLDAIKQRLAAYTDAATNTDEKLESGAIMDFVHYGESDVEWLLARVGELLEACEAVDALDGVSSWEMTEHQFDKAANEACEKIKAAIAKAKESEETK